MCQKELHNCFMITSTMLLQINESMWHCISILLCMDPSGKLPVVSINCSCVCNHDWLAWWPGPAAAMVLQLFWFCFPPSGAHFSPRCSIFPLSSCFTPAYQAATLLLSPAWRSSTRAAVCIADPPASSLC